LRSKRVKGKVLETMQEVNYWQRPAHASRNTRICELYRGGLSLREIAKVFGLSHERVRQILLRAETNMRPPGEPARTLPT